MNPAGVMRAMLVLFVVFACTNNPYPNEDADQKVLYSPFRTPPKTLDPAVAYSTVDHSITGPVYETLLEYHYLKRPYTLIPGIAEAIPKPRTLENGHVVYRFKLRDDLLFQDDPCFAFFGGGATRQVLASDVIFELMRIADPAVNSPVITTFAKVDGLVEFSKALGERREQDPDFAEQLIHRQYEALGGVRGIRLLSPLEFEIELSEAYPQILYWFAMEFTTPVPWEAVEYYDGEEGRPQFAEHPVGAGPYRLEHYNKRSRIVLEKNPNWYGIRHPEWQAPAAIYPTEGAPGDAERGHLDSRYVGKPLPHIERLEFRYEKETIPTFTKFRQGYYDGSGIPQQSFDSIVQNDELSDEMRELGIRLEKTVAPGVYYLGFNMKDDVVGAAAGERGRKLRQAMSLAVDAKEWLRIFLNGRGIPAQSPIPPGLFGFEEGYENPYRQPDLDRARQLLAEAGYPEGIDPATDKPLRLSFDTGNTSTQALIQYRFFTDAWRRIGLDVEVAATNYNKFREKVRDGAYQIFMWGWVADYPDPENFLFLLWGQMSQVVSQGPNTANYDSAAYNRLFLAMRSRDNDAQRLDQIREMRRLIEEDRPWIELFHPEDYALYHSWLKNQKPLGLPFSTLKYRDIDPAERTERREAWNRPVLWPAYALTILAVLIAAPGVVTFFRERQ